MRPGERRYDIGNFPSYYDTFVEFALADPDHGRQLRTFAKTLLSKYSEGAPCN